MAVANDEIIVGIDLGTTNSLVALVQQGEAQVLENEKGEALVPSVVHLEPMTSGVGDQFLVGNEAREKALEHPEQTLYSIKRLMGRSAADLSQEERDSLPFVVTDSERGLAQVQVNSRTMSPEEVSALVLRELQARAAMVLGRTVSKAVVTVPAYFDDAQRQATRVAGKLAGLDIVRIVNEPTAAALAYGLDRTRSGHVLVFDLGGGTFDVSVLEIRDGIFRVRSTAGDTQLGGDDFDRLLMKLLLQQLPEGTTPDPRLLQAAKQASEQAKIQLSSHEQVEYEVEDVRSGTRLAAKLSRADFEAAIGPLVQRTLDCCQRALDDADLTAEEIRAVVLVGGSSRVPLVRQRVEQFMGRVPYSGIDPDRVVAIGAAVQADILGGKARDLLLLDVLPLALGIETYGGAIAKIILRNSPIPAQASDTFTTYVDNQTGIDLHVLQGERELVQDCRSLARFHLKGLPPLPAGMVRVDVHFLVDENGVLTVRAEEKTAGIEAQVEVVPSYGLTDDEIARRVEDSFRFAREDMAAHQRIDLQNECRTMISATRRILEVGNHDLEQTDIDAIEMVMAEVEANVESAEVKDLKALYDRFVEATVPLAGQVMTEVAQKVVQGKTVDQVLAAKGTPVSAQGSEGAEKDCGDLGDGFRAAQAGGVAMKLTWQDADEIGYQLFEKFPGVDPLTVRFTDLHRHVTELNGFGDDAKGSSEGLLEAIQMAWYDEFQEG
jgi:Fe-S protein assembly chaperone HscA/FeS assembly protein IscX